MPFYEYQCSKCGHEEEVLQKVSDAPLKKCPACGKSAMKKLVSSTAFRLKGGGWYETDFKSGNKKNVVASESSSATNSGDNKSSGAAKKADKGTSAKKVSTQKG